MDQMHKFPAQLCATPSIPNFGYDDVGDEAWLTNGDIKVNPPVRVGSSRGQTDCSSHFAVLKTSTFCGNKAMQSLAKRSTSRPRWLHTPHPALQSANNISLHAGGVVEAVRIPAEVLARVARAGHRRLRSSKAQRRPHRVIILQVSVQV